MNRPHSHAVPSGGRERHHSHRQELESVDQIWPGYLGGGYFDGDGNLRIEFVSRDKVEPLVSAMATAQPSLTTGQLRRFFQHCRRIEAKLRSGETTWDQVRAQVLFLDAAAQDAYGKAPRRKIPWLFFDFISRNVQAIHGQDDFLRGFLPHFEALVGYGSAHIRREGT